MVSGFVLLVYFKMIYSIETTDYIPESINYGMFYHLKTNFFSIS